jgi:hypothetical protein
MTAIASMLIGALALSAAPPTWVAPPSWGAVTRLAAVLPVCSVEPEPPAYYSFPLVTTRRVPGTGQATGTAHVTFAPSPFGVALTRDGSYELDLSLSMQRLPEPTEGAFVVWLTTPTLDRIERAGVLTPGKPFEARVAWNKFLVVVTLESDPDTAEDVWSGPIVLRGLSRSGLMHTMAGHGPFEKENCAQYGY